MKVLVTGGAGYISGRLIPRLLEEGHQVRVLARDPRRLEGRPWAGRVEIVGGEVGSAEAVSSAVQGVEAVYYLVHGMCSADDLPSSDRSAAEAFARGAKGVDHVVFLGGIVPSTEKAKASARTDSASEVGKFLQAELPTTEFRVGPVIGSGSASFEMVRYLTERLPAMVAPRWIENEVQPIGVRAVLDYLVAVLGRKDALGAIDIGSDSLSFRDMMLQYAEERRLPRFILRLPILAPGLAARWVGLVTPIPNCLAVPLVQGVVEPAVGDLSRSRELFPMIRPASYRDAVGFALERIRRQEVPTRWSDELDEGETFRFEEKEGLIKEFRTRLVGASPEAVFRAFSSLGGDRGWLVWNWAWWLRGVQDKLIGGPGLGRGRRDPQELLLGEAVDFWRVEEVDPPHFLRLRAELKMPGRGWMQWEAREENGQTLLTQVATFAPRGFWGWAYWQSLYLFHARIFNGLIDGIVRLATEGDLPSAAIRDGPGGG